MNWTSGHSRDMASSMHSTFAEMSSRSTAAVADVIKSLLPNHETLYAFDGGSGRGRLGLELLDMVP